MKEAPVACYTFLYVFTPSTISIYSLFSVETKNLPLSRLDRKCSPLSVSSTLWAFEPPISFFIGSGVCCMYFILVNGARRVAV